jgi:hydroxylamine reductase
MFPAHAYPVLSKYNHLVGNYGTAWQKQKVEFGSFPGPIVVTSNCILHPRRSYKDRIYSTNEVGVDGVQHIGSGNGDGKEKDFSQVIEQALSMKGFTDTIEPHVYNTVGYNHRFMVPLVDKLIKSVKEGSLSHIFVIGGCDGTEWDRSYYTELAEQTPNDSVILTLGCAKNRVIHSDKLHNARLENGLPRVMDLGQCNDSYSAIVLAETMAKELNCDVNELPLSLALSHLEQKAAAVLLTLLSLGVRNIRLGPRLPAYVSDGVMDVLRERYNLLPTGVVKDDLKAMMEGH